MRNIFIYLFFLVLIVGCKTAPINKKVNNQKVGLWIEQDEMDSTKFKSIGRYKNNDPIKKWRYYTNNIINKKEVYRKNKCIVTNYFSNGKKQSKGKTKLILNSTEIHWFYSGKWKFYDEYGKLSSITKYEKGNVIWEKEINLKK